ncbi:MAG: deoxyribonuclease V [Natronomonas sp.]|jgi:deoxyribonuclease V
MELARPRFLPDPDRSREGMETLQRELADVAVFADDMEDDSEGLGTHSGPPVAGVDQAFRAGDTEEAVSAAVLVRGERVVGRASAVREAAIPYIPGLLSFREGEAVLAALGALSGEPAVTLVDGSGRVHFREAGLATHVGVALETPTVGVAKSLLCGQPRRSVEGLETGERVAIEADGDVTAPDGAVIGYAVQTRQFDSPNRHINPVYVSPGHRVSAATAADIVLACTAGYKLPEPTRLADAAADDLR